MKSIFRAILLGLGGAFVLASCAEQAGTGENVAIPTISFACTSSDCKSNVTQAVAYIYVTEYNCNASSYDFAAASSVFNVNCTVSGGCSGTAGNWVKYGGASTTTVPSRTYTVCGRIDYNNNFAAGVSNDDTTISRENVSITSTSGAIALTTWTDP